MVGCNWVLELIDGIWLVFGLGGLGTKGLGPGLDKIDHLIGILLFLITFTNCRKERR